MKNTLTRVLMVLLVMAFGVHAFALEHTVGIRGGISKPLFDIDENGSTKLMGGISYEAWLKDNLSLGIAPYYTGMEAGKDGTSYKATVLGADLLLKYRPVDQFALKFEDKAIKRISPFADLGLGVANYNTEGKISNLAFDEGKTAFVAPSLGLGVSLLTKWDINVDLGVQYDHPWDDRLDWMRSEGKDAYLMPYLGIGFNFGGKKEKNSNASWGSMLHDRISMDRSFSLKGVQFEVGSANLTEEAQGILDNVAAEMQKHPKVMIKINGHTDNTGSKELNDALSLKRAESVKNYLVMRGVEAGRMSTAGYGYSQPVASNDTPEGRAENRRIEFIIVK